MKTVNKILEELGAWLMAVAFIFIMFRFVAFIVGNINAGRSMQSGSYTSIDSTDTMEMKPVLFK